MFRVVFLVTIWLLGCSRWLLGAHNQVLYDIVVSICGTKSFRFFLALLTFVTFATLFCCSNLHLLNIQISASLIQCHLRIIQNAATYSNHPNKAHLQTSSSQKKDAKEVTMTTKYSFIRGKTLYFSCWWQFITVFGKSNILRVAELCSQLSNTTGRQHCKDNSALEFLKSWIFMLFFGCRSLSELIICFLKDLPLFANLMILIGKNYIRLVDKVCCQVRFPLNLWDMEWNHTECAQNNTCN